MNELDRVRADLWLWAARFFKTRRLAREALEGGKVALNGHRCKPSKQLVVGDCLRVTRASERLDIVVCAIADKRGPARVAQTLYEETQASRRLRERIRAEARLSQPVKPRNRPDKTERRRLREVKRGE